MTPSPSCYSSCQHTFSCLREGWVILRQKEKPLEGMLIKLSHKGLTKECSITWLLHHNRTLDQPCWLWLHLPMWTITHKNKFLVIQLASVFDYLTSQKYDFSSGFMSVSLSDLPGCSWLVGMPRCLIFFVVGVEGLKDSEDGQHKPQQSWLYKSAWKALGRRSRVKTKWNIKTNAWAYYQVES